MATVSAVSSSVFFHEGKGLDAYFFFEGNNLARLTKQDAKKFITALDNKEEAQIALRCFSLPFYHQATTRGLDIEALSQDIKTFLANKKANRAVTAVESAEALAYVLSMLAPNDSPEQLKIRFLALAEDTELVEEATAYLQKCIERCEKDGGIARNREGYLLLRRKAKKEAVTLSEVA